MFHDLFDMKSIYFNAAYLGPTPKKSKALLDAAVLRTMDPAFMNFEERMKVPDMNRARFAKLLGADAESIAHSTSVSELVSHVCNGMELKAQDEILLMQGDYPSMVLPWMVAAESKGLRLNFLEPGDFSDPARFAAKLTGRTRFAGCSHVMFNTGMTLPIAELGREARKAGVLFLSDVSQSFGAMQISPEIVANVDILVGVAYKWLLGPFGSAFGYFSPRALQEVRRTHASWLQSPTAQDTANLLNYTTDCLPGARKFDRGELPTFLIHAALEGGLQTMIDAGLDRVERHNRGLAEMFLASLPQGFEPVVPKDKCTPIVCVRPSREDAVALKKRLAQANIDVSVREGQVRLSFHMFNTREQVEKLLRVLG
jgi:selenocysteine lyase/cysteine desulfurase